MTPCGVGAGWGRGGRGQVWIHTGYHCMCTDPRRGGGRAAGGGVGEWGGGGGATEPNLTKVMFYFYSCLTAAMETIFTSAVLTDVGCVNPTRWVAFFIL